MCCTVTPGGGPNLRVGEVLPAIVPSAAKGELTDSDRSGEFTDGEDIFTAKKLSQNQLPSQNCVLTNAVRSCALPWTVVVEDVFNVNLRPSSLHPNNTPVPTEYQKESFEANLTLGRPQNCVFRQPILNPSKNWFSTSQHFLTRSLVQLVTFTVHSSRAFTFAL